MLQPKKNPLIDEPLIAASAGTFRRVKTTYWILLGIITIILLTWMYLLKSFGEEVYTEEWWRLSISRIVDWQFQKNVGLEQSSQLSENVKNLASQKAEMQERIQTLEKLVQATQSNGYLRQFSAVRPSGESGVNYELLVGNPDPGVVKDKKSVIRVIIRGVDNLDPLSPEKAISESIKRFRVVQHKIKVPEVAEAIKGRLESSVSNFIIATILPFDDVSKSEVIIVPITIQ
tara:strand:- start:849 stop:1541 length:693 start_codon:yes stop_codon:yes gene_type:complete